MMGQQAALQHAKGLMDAGMSAGDANVEMIRMIGVRFIGKTDKDTRKALMLAVSDGRLGHLKKDGLRPEAFFHPNSKANAMEQRDAKARESIQAIASVMVHHADLI